ncbi:Toxin-antitoxin system, antitoxin component, ribbon-helix-helix domain protein [uncultured Eubacteriales bacterium]|uniref:Toxin-antitoxin system, antitoxin component, ribbon-helix-helix domain protein n=1 Tax=uncultured Eubacteriales bacterium TaxID=172733 RepID=A0A212JSA5_9FIRM|nr:Toxin-antitoxin system, antitoxin component, ribbon-helix-helix domain protein [uncultured Eubacteriales bacterium]
MSTEAKRQGNRRYLEKMEQITIRFPEGSKDKIKAAAEKEGVSLNAFVVSAVEEKIDTERSKTAKK